MEREVNFEYDVKCRKCNKITRIHVGTNRNSSKKDFNLFILKHSNLPIHKQCSCDNGMMLLHDIVGYGNILDVL